MNFLDLELAAKRQDELLEREGLSIWIGAEPTFTRRDVQDPPWLSCAEGGDKEERARDLIRILASSLRTEVRVFRMKGRLYPEETTPRFCYGALWERASEGQCDSDPDDAGLWGAPLDPPAAPSNEALLTVTPDPGVVEVNTAPAPDLVTFSRWARLIFQAAHHAGLSPVRYRYNGQLTESGGGGQITLGGPSAQGSPFFLYPWLLPGLLRYFNRHPSLSYLFAPECIGSASQGPRPDEGVRERLEELFITLDRMVLPAQGTADVLWQAFAPLLVDASGNSHRAELNIEKLWNPHFGARGLMGVVEFRALRMQPSPERMTAVAGLLRAIAARIAIHPYQEPLIDWGTDLHDRFGLPFFLLRDLEEVLKDLETSGFRLDPVFEDLLKTPPEPLVRLDLDSASMILTPALEFWPLLGDVASQERSGARLVDSSSSRIEILVSVPDGEETGRVGVSGVEIPLQAAGRNAEGKHLSIAGVKFRTFLPNPGFHPGLKPHDPLVITWERKGRSRAVLLYQWIPSGGAYPGLPRDEMEAARRRAERVCLQTEAPPGKLRFVPYNPHNVTIDLRQFPIDNEDP